MTPASEFFCVGLSHHEAPVHIREQLALTSAEKLTLLSKARSAPEIDGLVYLSTCNRAEFYGSVERGNERTGLAGLATLLGEMNRSLEPLERFMYQKVGADAARHLARVACGLEALVLGEAEILGQVDRSLQLAVDQEAADDAITALFQFALETGRRVRVDTPIGRCPVSVSSVAVRKAQEYLGDLAGRTAAVVGLGETGRLVTKVLRRKGAEILFVNRTLSVAEQLADQDEAALGMADMPEVLQNADLLFSCTGCPFPIIGARLVSRVMAKRPARPLMMVDLAIPHDIEPAVAEIDGIHLLDVDAMNVDISESLTLREDAVPAVEAIIEEELTIFHRRRIEARVQPLITDLRRQAEHIRSEELDRLIDHLPELSEDVLEQIERFSQALVQKLFHHPTTGIRREASVVDPDDLARTVRTLFQLRDRAS